jgi:hypothetical protein
MRCPARVAVSDERYCCNGWPEDADRFRPVVNFAFRHVLPSHPCVFFFCPIIQILSIARHADCRAPGMIVHALGLRADAPTIEGIEADRDGSFMTAQ